jgi:hypothetical protein
MPTATPLPELILYSRPGCELCDGARAMIRALLAERLERDGAAPTLVERDIEADPAWERAFFATIPVVEIGGHRLETVTSLAKVRRLLSDVIDGEASVAADIAVDVAG